MPDSTLSSLVPLRAKSLALVEKTRYRVTQLDPNKFPTESCNIVRDLLLEVLNSLGKKANWKATEPVVFFRALLKLQTLVEHLESSSCDHVSWPIVNYCDHFWKLLFPDGKHQIFYSVFPEHNFGIISTNLQLEQILGDILGQTEIRKIIGINSYYCLQIASIENENLPLYANIGHEFGHALFLEKEPDIVKLLRRECLAVSELIRANFVGKTHADELARTTWRIIKGIAIELFCDLVGLLIAGPAFALSLYEMGWGSQQHIWKVEITPKDKRIRAYPSFAFRLACIIRHISPESFKEEELLKLCESVPEPQKDNFRQIFLRLSQIPHDSEGDVIAIAPNHDGTSVEVESAIAKYLGQLKEALGEFANSCYNEVLTPFRGMPEFAPVSSTHIFALLQRLDAKILPNIIPVSGSLLGEPASFPAILNASALYRMEVLCKKQEDPEVCNAEIQKVERLTAKAMEVSYIQKEFKNWELKGKNGSK